MSIRRAEDPPYAEDETFSLSILTVFERLCRGAIWILRKHLAARRIAEVPDSATGALLGPPLREPLSAAP